MSPKESPKERIFDAALRLFAARGIAAVPLRTIAAEVGLHNSTLFHYFPNKRELARQLLERVIERLVVHIEPLAHDEPPSLDTFVEVYLDVARHYWDHPEEACFVLRDLIDWPELGGIDTDSADPDNPIYRLFAIIWGWLDRARRAEVIRPVRITQAARILFGIVLYDPAAEIGNTYPGGPKRARDKIRLYRLGEVESFVRAALTPHPEEETP